MNILNEEFNNSKDYTPSKRDWLAAFWAGFKGPEQLSRVRNTGYAACFLRPAVVASEKSTAEWKNYGLGILKNLVCKCIQVVGLLLKDPINFCDSVKPEVLKEVGKAITTLPTSFNPHKAIKRVYDQRAQMIEKGEGVDWATAEALAFGTLLVEGNHVRLSGQDVERGTFSHRHAVVHDQKNGQIYCPLGHVLKAQADEMFTVCNR